MKDELIPAGPMRRENNFDALRMALALCVIVSHAFPIYYGGDTPEPGYKYTGGMLDLGKASVIGFFFLSGVLISASWERSPTAGRFFSNRIRRIYPAFLVMALLIGAVFLSLMAQRGFAILSAYSVARLLAGAALLCAWMPPSGVFDANPLSHVANGSAWSLPYEFGCYFVCAGVLTLMDLRRRGPALLLLALAMGMLVWSGHWWQARIGTASTRCVATFGLGMLAYAHRDRIFVRQRWLAMAALAVPVVTRLSPALALPLMVSLVSAVLMRLAFSRRVRLHRFGKYGDFSYGTYLWGFFIQQTLAHEFGRRLPFPAFLAISVTLAVGAGVLSWHLVERWCIARRPAKVLAPLPLLEAVPVVELAPAIRRRAA